MRPTSIALVTVLLALPGCPAPGATPAFDAGATGSDTGTPGDAGTGSDSGGGVDASTVDAASEQDAAVSLDGGDGGAMVLDGGGSDAGTIGDAGGSDAATVGDAGGSPAPAHLVFSEIGVAPAGGEMIEIWNPTPATVSLAGYYVSDNSLYHRIAAGMPFNPPLATAGTDFLVTFPPDASIGAGQVVVIATDPSFVTQWSRCPDFILAAADLACAGGGTARAMSVPTNGARGAMAGLSNSREMVVLFRWNGTETTVHDVDYVTWGATFDAETRIDKTGVAGYAADTSAAAQQPAAAPMAGETIERCGGEIGETATGGNGVSGHDETSERLDTAFRVQTAPTPGVHTSCL